MLLTLRTEANRCPASSRLGAPRAQTCTDYTIDPRDACATGGIGHTIERSAQQHKRVCARAKASVRTSKVKQRGPKYRVWLVAAFAIQQELAQADTYNGRHLCALVQGSQTKYEDSLPHTRENGSRRPEP